MAMASIREQENVMPSPFPAESPENLRSQALKRGTFDLSRYYRWTRMLSEDGGGTISELAIPWRTEVHLRRHLEREPPPL